MRMLVAALLMAACARAPYPAPTPRGMPVTELPTSVEKDPGDEARVRQMEQQCRQRLSGTSTSDALGRIDDVRQVLGAGCDFAAIGHDPFHWRLQCSADALFANGGHALIAKPATCAATRTKVAPWSCVGAALARLVAGDEAPLDGLEVAIVGHADLQPIAGSGDGHVCSTLQEHLGFEPPGQWQPLQEDAADEAKLYANRQLAWCRAASVAEALRAGLGAEAERTELAVLGMGASWADERGHCDDAKSAKRTDCTSARRVDVLVSMHPRASTETSTCAQAAPGLDGALACLQDCVERAALGSAPLPRGADTTIAAAPLFVDGRGDAATLPAGWYLHRAPKREGRRLALDRVCGLLGIDEAHCAR